MKAYRVRDVLLYAQGEACGGCGDCRICAALAEVDEDARRNGHTHNAPNPSKIHPVPGCYKCEEEVRLFTGG